MLHDFISVDPRRQRSLVGNGGDISRFEKAKKSSSRLSLEVAGDLLLWKKINSLMSKII
jgi:hypothetical protein